MIFDKIIIMCYYDLKKGDFSVNNDKIVRMLAYNGRISVVCAI